MNARNLLLLSNSRNAEGAFLEHARDALRSHLAGVSSLLFVPWAGVTITHANYAARVREAFATLNLRVSSIHESPDTLRAVEEAEAIVIGGGNTFRLLEQLQHHALIGPIRRRVLSGVPYVGWSAGSVVACPTIGTTNDMPIVATAGLDALALVNFQINAHFTDAHPVGFRGETRRERIAEYLTLNKDARVVGLPEGAWLRVHDTAITLEGPHLANCFTSDGAVALSPGRMWQDLLEPAGF